MWGLNWDEELGSDRNISTLFYCSKRQIKNFRFGKLHQSQQITDCFLIGSPAWPMRISPQSYSRFRLAKQISKSTHKYSGVLLFFHHPEGTSVLRSVICNKTRLLSSADGSSVNGAKITQPSLHYSDHHWILKINGTFAFLVSP